MRTMPLSESVEGHFGQVGPNSEPEKEDGSLRKSKRCCPCLLTLDPLPGGVCTPAMRTIPPRSHATPPARKPRGSDRLRCGTYTVSLGIGNGPSGGRSGEGGSARCHVHSYLNVLRRRAQAINHRASSCRRCSEGPGRIVWLVSRDCPGNHGLCLRLLPRVRMRLQAAMTMDENTLKLLLRP